MTMICCSVSTGQIRGAGSIRSVGSHPGPTHSQHLRRTGHSTSGSQAGPGHRGERVQHQPLSRTKFAQRRLSGHHGVSQLDQGRHYLRGRLR